MTDHDQPPAPPEIVPTPPERELLRVLREVRFGQVAVQVHGGRVVQIERTERFRSDHRPAQRGT